MENLSRRVALAVVLAMAASAATAAEPTADDDLGEVTVTGTRIQQSVGMTTPTPVAALTADEIVAMAPGSLTEAMTQLPQFYASATAENFNSGSNGFFASPGGGSLNLRGVGSRRTLTLLDGRRVVPASVYGGPDINMFPTEMLARVESVTGGASAQYGTDAVSGCRELHSRHRLRRFPGARADGRHPAGRCRLFGVRSRGGSRARRSLPCALLRRTCGTGSRGDLRGSRLVSRMGTGPQPGRGRGQQPCQSTAHSGEQSAFHDRFLRRPHHRLDRHWRSLHR